MKDIPLLHANVEGDGPTVVLLHGFLASSRYWNEVTKLVSKRYKVVAIDLLGFGFSPKPRKSDYDYEAHISSINATLDQLGIHDPFILMGHSMGSLIALRFANVHEDKVKRLILTNLPVTLSSSEAKQTYYSINIMHRLGLMPYTHRVTWSIFRLLYVMRMLPKKARKSVAENSEFVFQHNAYSRFRTFNNVIANAQTALDLSMVQVKTQIIAGINDRKIYMKNLMYNVIPNPNVVLETHDTGHHIPRVMPEVVARQLDGIYSS